MNTAQIAPLALEGYKNSKLSDERINFLIAQANEQLDEIAQNKELHERFMEEVDAPQEIDAIILWILFMSNEDICSEYIDACNKPFNDTTPVNDLADLLIYAVYLNRVHNTPLEGYDYLLEYEEDGLADVDQFALTNAFLYIQKSKEVAIDFSF
ncbi:MAG TPA: hypothetical protein PLH07_09020 [Sulfurovum sp.]|jgi:hypothetical protein|nr:MAG: hypothetical protein B7Y63_05305 [Sulfurovum sp. 35-42-20]OYZ24569.1 MAG: hypothetical protein B7Y23_08770 [Sulfurovum sp. 16-42-52]OYZ48779.1 MAG: hypothetical protein B7Y13_06735 [Sulfurovum sp. 24-42-9]OZA44606.1 MAG: hypothetical protein B7X80_07460 [Sulfurovum sp. 17-42-90]OZA61493.1 MAG: hypothetical protein B7X69_00280 [Sulfurovum sp. 39-42-12]HQR74678.1 hypothetical protein [Sulfurovum sp.]